MIFTKEINGTYGSGNTPATILVANDTYMNWYCVEGSQNVNGTYEELEEGTNIEQITDIDTFTTAQPINTLAELEAAIEA